MDDGSDWAKQRGSSFGGGGWGIKQGWYPENGLEDMEESARQAWFSFFCNQPGRLVRSIRIRE